MGASANAARALLRARGSTGTYRKTTGATYDPATRSYSGGSTQTVSVTMAVSPFSEEELEGANISRGDLHGIVAATELEAAGIAPQAGDALDFDGTRYRVTPLETVFLSASPVAYLMQLRALASD